MNKSEKIENIRKWLGTGSINVFGRPLSGKDTQCSRLAELLGSSLIGTGDIFRGANMPDNVKECMRNGKLVPTQDFINIILPYLSKQDFSGRCIILNSVGRWHGEEPGVINAITSSGHPLKAVINLELSESAILDRLDVATDREYRRDDDTQVILTRFSEFEEKTIPVIKFYREMNIVIDINGDEGREKITDDIIDALYDFSNKTNQ